MSRLFTVVCAIACNGNISISLKNMIIECVKNGMMDKVQLVLRHFIMHFDVLTKLKRIRIIHSTENNRLMQ